MNQNEIIKQIIKCEEKFCEIENLLTILKIVLKIVMKHIFYRFYTNNKI